MSEAKNTKHDPRVGLSVIAMDDPYKERNSVVGSSSTGPIQTSQ
jgi:hypothetical protein